MQISLVKFKDLNYGVRLDAEYYKPNFLEVELLLRRVNCEILDNVSKSIKSFGAYALCNQMVLVDKGIPFIRCKDIKEGFVDFSQVLFIDDATHRLLSKSSVAPLTVMLTMSGTVGNSTIADPAWKYPINSNQDIAKIETNDLVNPYYLTVFFNGKYGKSQTERLPIGSIQQHIFIWQLKGLLIFIPSQGFQSVIAKLYTKAIKSLSDSEMYYQEAERTLLSELGLLNWMPEYHLSFVRNFSDTKSADRIDAEYFQPMYEEVEAILSKRRRVSLDTLCSIINYGTVPTSPYCENGIPYIKGLNLINGFIEGEFDRVENTQDLPKKFYVKENDIVISQMGTVGKAGIVTKDQDDYLFASFTIRIRLKNYNFIDPYVLTLYINKVAREWYLMRKIAQASVRQNTDLPTIKGLMVPEIDKNVQQQIREKILNTHTNKLNSKRLLNIAKHGVELAIEKTEKDAEKWIKRELDKLGVET